MQFQYSIVQELYSNDYRIAREVIQEIRQLGSAVEQDLLAILDDATQNADYYETLPSDEGRFAPLHAILLLREIRSSKVCKKILQMLQGDVWDIDRLFHPDFLTEEIWTYICHLGHQDLDTCKSILFEGNADVYARTAISTGLAQMALHYPEKREAVRKIYQKLLDFVLAEESLEVLAEEEGIFGEEPDFEADVEFISNFACDLLDADFNEFQAELDSLFENGLIDEEILEEANAVFKKNPLSYKSIEEFYLEMEKAAQSALEEADEEEDDEPKIKKMKE
ncbi:DUF1186 domain-containing protein [Raineya sp.]|jgi:hypothetical protein